MREFAIFTAIFSLFLLVPASKTSAQTETITGTVSMEQDYRTVNFSTLNGNIKVILPGDLSGAGQGPVTLIGTVMAEPAGKTQKEKGNNLKALQKLVLTIGGKAIPILAGQNLFNFSPPVNSMRTVPIDVYNPLGDRAVVTLKNPVVSPPPTTGNLSPHQPALFTDQKIFLTDGNIPVYAVNNTATLFQPTDKFFVSDASGNMKESAILAQSPTQTVLSGAGIQPGSTTITRQSVNRTDHTKVRMVSLTLSSTNNNLKKGQTSTLTVTIDPKITDKDSAEAMQIPVMSLDIKNLTPAVINMEGGNIQVMTFPAKSNSISSSDWQMRRTITGVTPGTFNISATLYPSTAFDGLIQAQKQALNTPGDFNRWAEGIKKDLDVYIKKPDKDKYGLKEIAQYALSNMPVCRSDEDLETCKWAAGYLLRFIHDFKPAL